MRLIDELMCTALRGERPQWPWGISQQSASQELLQRAEAHGVEALLHAHLARSNWPESVRLELRNRSMRLAMWELGHQHVLARVLSALNTVDVTPVLLKGTALAYSLYADPALRTRGDTDMLVPASRRQAVREILLSSGYRERPAVTGELVSYQSSYWISAEGGTHNLDVHWRINNSELLSGLFTYEELRDRAMSLPRLSSLALGTSHVDALMIACVHRATHKTNPYFVRGQPQHDANRLVWLHDIHLLAASFGAHEWQALVERSMQKGLGGVCLDGLEEAALRFGTCCPSPVLGALAAEVAKNPVAKYLQAGRWRQQWIDFTAIGGWPGRLQFISESLVPPADYMRTKYPGHFSTWLPLLYLRRIWEGLAKRLVLNWPP